MHARTWFLVEAWRGLLKCPKQKLRRYLAWARFEPLCEAVAGGCRTRFSPAWTGSDAEMRSVYDAHAKRTTSVGWQCQPLLQSQSVVGAHSHVLLIQPSTTAGGGPGGRTTCAHPSILLWLLSEPCTPARSVCVQPLLKNHNPRTFEDLSAAVPNFRTMNIKAGDVPKFFDAVLSARADEAVTAVREGGERGTMAQHTHLLARMQLAALSAARLWGWLWEPQRACLRLATRHGAWRRGRGSAFSSPLRHVRTHSHWPASTACTCQLCPPHAPRLRHRVHVHAPCGLLWQLQKNKWWAGRKEEATAALSGKTPAVRRAACCAALRRVPRVQCSALQKAVAAAGQKPRDLDPCQSSRRRPAAL